MSLLTQSMINLALCPRNSGIQCNYYLHVNRFQRMLSSLHLLNAIKVVTLMRTGTIASFVMAQEMSYLFVIANLTL